MKSLTVLLVVKNMWNLLWLMPVQSMIVPVHPPHVWIFEAGYTMIIMATMERLELHLVVLVLLLILYGLVFQLEQ